MGKGPDAPRSMRAGSPLRAGSRREKRGRASSTCVRPRGLLPPAESTAQSPPAMTMARPIAAATTHGFGGRRAGPTASSSSRRNTRRGSIHGSAVEQGQAAPHVDRAGELIVFGRPQYQRIDRVLLALSRGGRRRRSGRNVRLRRRTGGGGRRIRVLQSALQIRLVAEGVTIGDPLDL